MLMVCRPRFQTPFLLIFFVWADALQEILACAYQSQASRARKFTQVPAPSSKLFSKPGTLCRALAAVLGSLRFTHGKACA